jgi:hypothetical protein
MLKGLLNKRVLLQEDSDFHSSNVYRLLARQSAERRQRGKPTCRSEGIIIKVNFKDLGFKVVNLLSWLIVGNDFLCL